MAARRVLIIANKAVADRPAGVPEVVRKQVLEADEVRVVAPAHAPDVANWRERGFTDKVRARFELPVTEMLLDSDGRVLSVATP